MLHSLRIISSASHRCSQRSRALCKFHIRKKLPTVSLVIGCRAPIILIWQTRSSRIPTLTINKAVSPYALSAVPLCHPTISTTVILARTNSLLSSSCPTLSLLPHRPRPHPHPTSNTCSIMPWIRTKNARRTICVHIHSPRNCKPAILRPPLLLFFNNNSRG